MRIIDSIKMSERLKLNALILAIFVMGGLLFSCLVWLIIKLEWWFILLMLFFFSWIAFSNWLSKKSICKAMCVISDVVSAPVKIGFWALALTQPFTTIAGTYFFILLYAFGVPVLILKGLTYFFNLGLLPETICFLVIAGGSVLCANSYRLTQWMVRQTPLSNKGNHKYEEYRENLSIYLVHPSNVIFLLYLLYFVFLTVTGYMQIQNGVDLLPAGFDSAVLKAFLVFIAFTNMRTKAKESELDAKELLRQTMRLFVFDK